jgi:hypothetical protein
MASIKERMVQALNSKGIDTSNVDISKNSQGYWEAHVCGIILRVRQGETWACAGGGLARGSVSSKKTGLGDIEEALDTAIRRRDIAGKIGTDILRWTRMEVLPLISTVGSDIIVLAPSGAVFGINFSGRSLGRQESAFVSEVSTEGSSDRETDLARDLLYEVINSIL